MNPITNMKNLNKMNQREIDMGVAGTGKSWHNQYKDSAWVYAGGLPYDLTEGDVVCVFSQYGEIVHINLVRDHKTGKSRGFAFVCYEDQRSTILAVDNLNGMKLLGRLVRVDHVHTYKLPKDLEKMDADRKKLFLEGCAPKPLEQPDVEESEGEELLEYKSEKKDKKKKKEKKKSSKKKKKKRKEQSSSSESSSSDDESSSSSSDDEDRKKRRRKEERKEDRRDVRKEDRPRKRSRSRDRSPLKERKYERRDSPPREKYRKQSPPPRERNRQRSSSRDRQRYRKRSTSRDRKRQRSSSRDRYRRRSRSTSRDRRRRSRS